MANFIVDKFYNKFYIGILSILTGFSATLLHYFLGFLMGLILLIGGVYAVIISKQTYWLKGIVLGLVILFMLYKFNVISF